MPSTFSWLVSPLRIEFADKSHLASTIGPLRGMDVQVLSLTPSEQHVPQDTASKNAS